MKNIIQYVLLLLTFFFFSACNSNEKEDPVKKEFEEKMIIDELELENEFNESVQKKMDSLEKLKPAGSKFDAKIKKIKKQTEDQLQINTK